MLRLVEVLGGVLVLRRIAAADMTAFEAQPQVHPGVTHGQAFLATVRRIRFTVQDLRRDRAEVGTRDLAHAGNQITNLD